MELPLAEPPWPEHDGAALKADENVQGHTEGKEVVKVIVVPGRLVNVVVK